MGRADGDHPARRASQRSYAAVSRRDLEEWLTVYGEDAVVEDPVGPSMSDPDGAGHHGRDAIRKFWAAAIEPVATCHFHITDSHANGIECANIGTITTTFHDGGQVDTELVMVYRVIEDGLPGDVLALPNSRGEYFDGDTPTVR